MAALLLRKSYVKTAAASLIVLYVFLATLSVIWWSITVPFGLLMFGFCVILGGIIIGPRYTIATFGLATAILLLVQLLTNAGLITPDRTSVIAEPTLLDVVGYGVVFFIMALVSWISGRQMERSLEIALSAETALLVRKGI